MANVQPFAALRPRAGDEASVSSPPYDVLSSVEARAMSEGNLLSFLHVSKPEIDLGDAVDPYSDEVYAKGADNFRAMQNAGTLLQDTAPAFYLYRQIMGNHTQTGIVAVADCDEYGSGTIKKHELTRPAKEDDRVRHMEALNAQTGLVFLTYRSEVKVDAFVGDRCEAEPDFDFNAADGVQHTGWTVADEEGIEMLRGAFAGVEALYIADGHHRSAAAARVCNARAGSGNSGRFIAVIFPDHQMQILAYNRVVQDLNGMSPDLFLEALAVVFEIEGDAQPEAKGELAMFLQGQWRRLRFRPEYAKADLPQEGLDVALLQRHVLSPMLGIDDPRTSDRIEFVGGIRGITELERRAQSGCAFAMHPTGIADLLAVADAGGLMPPKSTWFEPKLRDGLFCHML